MCPCRHVAGMANDVVTLDQRALLQMVGPLPAGEIVDHVICDAVTSKASGVGSIPFGNRLSPRGVKKILDIHSEAGAQLLPSILSGLRDEEAVRAAAARADEPWMQWAVHLNPASEALRRRELPHIPSFHRTGDGDPMRLTEWSFLSSLPWWQWVKRQKSRRLWRSYVKWLPHHFEMWKTAWEWDYLPWAHDGLFKILGESMYFRRWEEASRTNLIVSEVEHRLRIAWDFGRSRENLPENDYGLHGTLNALTAVNDPEHWPHVTRLLTDRQHLFARGPAVFRSDLQLSNAGGAAFMNAWLPGVLWSDTTAWRTVLALGGKPVAGSLVGEALFKVTGDDPGLWFTATSLLDEWDDSLPNWLEAVAALK